MSHSHSEQASAPPRQQAKGGNAQESASHERNMYLRFGAMVLTSTVVMFLLTYTNVYTVGHIRWSQERLYMALLMGSVMAIVMLAFMWSMMYRNVKINVGILAVASAIALVALLMSRGQFAIGNRLYMEGMIPHHSIAILTSERANITDLRVAELAHGISSTQRQEIKEMTWLVDDITKNGPATTPAEAAQRPVPDFSGAH